MYLNELITKRNYVTQKAKSCYSDNWYLPKKGLPTNLYALGTKLADMIRSPAQGMEYQNWLLLVERKVKKMGSLGNMERCPSYQKESRWKARAALCNSVATRHMGLLKVKEIKFK